VERSAAGPQASSRTSRSAAPGQPDIDYIMITAGQQPQQQHQATSRPGPAKPAAIPLIWVLFGVCRR